MAAPRKGAATRKWRMKFLRNDGGWEGPLIAHWEVNLSSMSDDYTPDEISAVDLFAKWRPYALKSYPDGRVPIYWFVESPGQGKFESMPFQDWLADEKHQHFLSFYSWPVDVVTGERINWLQLPVRDFGWNSKRCDKGGFIQEATGWKPGILQPFVYLPSLAAAISRGE